MNTRSQDKTQRLKRNKKIEKSILMKPYDQLEGGLSGLNNKEYEPSDLELCSQAKRSKSMKKKMKG